MPLKCCYSQVMRPKGRIAQTNSFTLIEMISHMYDLLAQGEHVRYHQADGSFEAKP